VLTGGAYLHLSNSLCEKFSDKSIKDALLLFGSTSPSYLILQSLDMANAYLESYSILLSRFSQKVEIIKNALTESGYTLYGDEALKITVCAKDYGYYGYELKEILLQCGVVCEFCDRDFVVMMFTPKISDEDLKKLLDIMLSIPKREAIKEKSPCFAPLKKGLTVRDAMLSLSECLPAEQCLGRVVAISSIGCPPAVPIAVAGEIIDESAIKCFNYFGIDKINVVK
jgi:arginine/lysine/ornithine decarboxylase